MQDKHLQLLEKMDGFFRQFEEKKAGKSSILDKFGRQIEDIEKDIAILKSESHPPVFSAKDYKDLVKKVKTLEKNCKCKGK